LGDQRHDHRRHLLRRQILDARFRLHGGTYTALEHPLATIETKDLTGISGSKIIGTYRDDSNVYRNFIFDGTDFSNLQSPLASVVYLNGISGHNIVGYYVTRSGDQSLHDHGFFYDGTNFTEIAVPAAMGSETVALGVSGKNIVGDFSTFRAAVPQQLVHGFVYDGTVFTVVDHPKATILTAVRGISGENAVGDYFDANHDQHGFIVSIASLLFPPTGSLKVALTPTPATGAGATWHVDDGLPQSSGVIVGGLSAGPHNGVIQRRGRIRHSSRRNCGDQGESDDDRDRVLRCDDSFQRLAGHPCAGRRRGRRGAMAGGWRRPAPERRDRPGAFRWQPYGHFQCRPRATPAPAAQTAAIFENGEALLLGNYSMPAGTTPFAGSYRGLLADQNGSVTLVLTAKGVFTGTVVAGSVSYAIRGRFDASGQFSGKAGALSYTLQEGAASTGALSSVRPIFGFGGGVPFTLFHTTARSSVAKNLGRSTVTLVPLDSDPSIPQTGGLATIQVRSTGAAIFAGTVPGRTKFTAASVVVEGVFGNQCMVSKPPGFIRPWSGPARPPGSGAA